MNLYGLIGAGGFGREVMPLVQQRLQRKLPEDDFRCVFVVEDQYEIKEKVVNGFEVISMTEFLSWECDERFYNIAIGDSKARERIVESISSNAVAPFSIVANEHVELSGNSIGEGAVFCSYTHVTSNAKIGKFFHCNIYSYVAHDCVVGDYVTFGPFVKCNGHVVIENHAYIGTGAIIKDGTHKPIVIGEGAVVGMGAVVTKSVPPGVTVVGNPARPIQRS